LRLLYATVLQKAKKYEEAQALYKQPYLGISSQSPSLRSTPACFC
jgi:hypothetical protein